MNGYTPVFGSVFTGTLAGKYPDTAAWLFLLALSDKNGVVDMTPQVISMLTGMPVKDLLDCIERFLQPDPASRTSTDDGRRLALVDPARSWGWKIVNHGKYRERARKQAWDAERTASGRDAERKRAQRAIVPTCPDVSRLSPLSNTDTNTEREAHERRGFARRCPADFSPDLSFALSVLPDIDAAAEAANFKDCEFTTPHKDWGATWRRWIRTCKSSGRYAKKDAIKWT